MTKTVSVAVPRPVWNSYAYSLPHGMQGGSILGCRVVVPLGGGRVVGFVTGEDPQVPSDVTLKPVLQRLDSRPLLPVEVFHLLNWAAEYYMAPPGMTIAAAFPPGMQGKAVRMIRTFEGSRYHYATGGKPIEYRLLLSIVPENPSPEAVLAAEAEMGLADSWWIPQNLPPARKTTVVEPLQEPKTLIKTAQSLKSAAPRQAGILACLASQGRMPRAELLRKAGGGRSSIDRLREMGLIREVIEEIPRDPLQAAASISVEKKPELNCEQMEAVNSIISGGAGTYLLYGITGSGKTEVYLNLIEKTLENGKSAIVRVPEISLTPLAVSRFSGRFPGMVAVLHSGLSRGERLDMWNMVRRGEKRIVIGPRSAVFAPLADPGIIVVDEEHDGSYKQGTTPRYNGRDMAVARGSFQGIPVVLGSASPSAESWKNALEGRYTLLRLTGRATGMELPGITLVDSSESGHPLLSDTLLAAIGKRTAAGEQSIILINRRGHSPVQMCMACGHVEKCPSCGIAMTYHIQGEMLRCHHCGGWKSASSRCPDCSGEEFARRGPGIQKVEKALGELLPATRVIRMDADTTGRKSAHWNILQRFSRGEGDVLLGTQMVAKGHDFPGVTLAAVIAAEMGLYIPDFRAAENTFDLLLQISGRSGRSRKPGEVIIQTLNPDDPVITLASRHDYEGFITAELNERKALGFPPWTRMARLLWTGSSKTDVRSSAESSCNVSLPAGARMLGPSEAAMARIADTWRWSALITAGSHKALQAAVSRIAHRFHKEQVPGVRLDTDIDPRNLM